MKKLLSIIVLALLWCNVGFAESKREQVIKEIANAAYESKLCIMNISSSLNSIKYSLLRSHEELATELVTRLNNSPNKKWVPYGYVDKFGRLHGHANKYTNCNTFPYVYLP